MNNTIFFTEDKYLQVIAHLYRGEMNRLTTYRQRLDITSNWSITILSVMMYFYIGNSTIPVYFIILIFLTILFFSFVEGRRYRYYHISQYRIRLIEKGFYCNQILSNIYDNNNSVDYKMKLFDNLNKPKYEITIFRSWLIRIQRNYIWLSYLIFIGFIIKLYIMNLILVKYYYYILIFAILIFFHFILYSLPENEIDI